MGQPVPAPIATESQHPGIESNSTDPELMKEMELLLDEALALQEHRVTSAPTVLSQDTSDLRYAGGSLLWRYRNTGDYDQNGEVNAADLAMIARFYRLKVPDDDNSVLATVDGNGDGFILQNDITPIAVNYRSRISGFNVYRSPEKGDYPEAAGPNGAGAEFLGNIGLGDSEGAGRLAFRFDVGDVANFYYWVRPTDGTAEGIASSLLVGGSWPIESAPVQLRRQSLNTGPSTGMLLQSLQLTTEFARSPVLSESGGFLVASGEGKVQSVSAGAQVLWQYSANDEVLESPLEMSDGTVCFGCQDGKVRRVDAAGQFFSVFDAGMPVPFRLLEGNDSSLLVAAEKALISVGSNNLELWRHEFGTTLSGAPEVALNGNLILSTTDGLLSLFTNTGQLLWQADAGTAILAAPAVGLAGESYICTELPRGLMAFDAQGKHLWDFHTESSITAAAAVAADGRIFFSTIEGMMHCLNPDGSEAWRLETGPNFDSTPIIGADGVIYVASFGGNVQAVNRYGIPLWESSGPDSLRSSFEIDSSGRLLTAFRNGAILMFGDNGGNLLPVARLQANRTSGPAPFTVSFDASASTDDEGISLYEWDLDGDGIYEISGTDAQISHEYPLRGTYHPRLKVTDSGGSSNEDSLVLSFPSAWSMPGMDEFGSRRSPYVAADLSQLSWELEFPSSLFREPVISAGGEIVLPCDNGELYAVSTVGEVIWTFPVAGKVSPAAIGNDGTIFAGSESGTSQPGLYAIHPDGNQRWKLSVEGYIHSCKPRADGTVLAIGSEGILYAVEENGTEIWRYGGLGFTSAPPVMDDQGNIYVASHSHMLTALDANGGFRWEFEAAHVLHGVSVSRNGNILLGCDSGKLYCLAPNGSLLWDYSFEGSILSAISCSPDGSLYFGSNDEHIYALHADGSLRWKIHTGRQVRSSPCIDERGFVYIGSGFTSLFRIDGGGTVLGTYSMDQNCWSDPVVDSNGTVYIADGTRLLAFGDSQGF
ncbi:PQQ-binding-like beta-propeller repeat protein [bacterium]|nr:PQQ-binding-like beta-propeller repeat protein [bacterium]